jgi:hypothetical protein
MKYLVIGLLVAGAAVLPSGGLALAAPPGQNCQSLILSGAGGTPGNSGASSGSPFNQATGGTAGANYAGNSTQTIPEPLGTHEGNGVPVSQYDVACQRNQS